MSHFFQSIAPGPVGEHGDPAPQHVAKELSNVAEMLINQHRMAVMHALGHPWKKGVVIFRAARLQVT